MTFHSSGFLFPPVSLCPHEMTVYLLHTTPTKTCSLLLCIGPTSQMSLLILCARSELLPTTKKAVIFQIYLDFSPSHMPLKKAPLTLSCSSLQDLAFPLSSPALRGYSSVVSGMFCPLLAPLWEDSGADMSAAFPAEQGAIYSKKQL